MPHARAVEGGGPKPEARLWLEEIEIEEKKIGMTQTFGVEIVFLQMEGDEKRLRILTWSEWEPADGRIEPTEEDQDLCPSFLPLWRGSTQRSCTLELQLVTAIGHLLCGAHGRINRGRLLQISATARRVACCTRMIGSISKSWTRGDSLVLCQRYVPTVREPLLGK